MVSNAADVLTDHTREALIFRASLMRLSKNHVIASQCSHWRGNPPDIQIFSILNQQLLRSTGGFPHQSADWFGMTPYLSDFFDTLIREALIESELP